MLVKVEIEFERFEYEILQDLSRCAGNGEFPVLHADKESDAYRHIRSLALTGFIEMRIEHQDTVAYWINSAGMRVMGVNHAHE